MGLLSQMTQVGTAAGVDFPWSTKMNFGKRMEDKEIILSLPNKEEYKITPDKIESASLLAMGIIGKGVNGAKYQVVLKDGKKVILTVEATYMQQTESFIIK